MSDQYISIDDAKRMSSRRAYRLVEAEVFISPTGFHYINYLDPEVSSPQIDPRKLTAEERLYIERALQSNQGRFDNQANMVSRYIKPRASSILDIGCGGGLFLETLQNAGAKVTGIELNDSRAQYAIEKGIDVHKRPIEDPYWEAYVEYFDAICLWDVIEHVNYPFRSLRHALRTLKPGGYLFIDTPCRDSFYHWAGELTYKISCGRLPTFLNAMYSARPFSHKQIFSSIEMKEMALALNLSIAEFRKFHELSFPYAHYLRKLMKSDLLVSLSVPIVQVLFKILKIRNKMLLVARKE